VINSNVEATSYLFQDMASFPLKNAIFAPLFSPKFKHVFLALHPANFVRSEPWHKAKFSCKMFSLGPNA